MSISGFTALAALQNTVVKVSYTDTTDGSDSVDFVLVPGVTADPVSFTGPETASVGPTIVPAIIAALSSNENVSDLVVNEYEDAPTQIYPTS